MIKKLKPIEKIALDKAVNGEAKEARSRIKPGQYKVDFTVCITGTVNIGEDYEIVKSQVDPWALLALAFSKLNQNQIDICIDHANRFDIDSDEIKKYVKERSKFERVECAGKVNTNLFIEG